jgi:glycosyltransferase involved in cell wall biosynthesis
MHRPKVSVIIPNCNHARYLEQRIESVLHQSFTDFEVILLDDHSTDGSREVIGRYATHEKISAILFNEKNSGTPFKQWQRGVELACGEWIWIAESDDYADKTFLEKMIQAIGNRRDIGLAYCDSYIVQNGAVQNQTFIPIKNTRHKTTRWSRDYVDEGVAEIQDYLLADGTINNTSAVLFNSKALRDANPFDVQFRLIGDKYTFIKVLAKSCILYVAETLNYYRDPFNSKHADKSTRFFYEHFLVFDWVYRNIEVSNKRRFFDAFYSNTRVSLFRNWNREKILVYWMLWRRNRYLLTKNVGYNFIEAFRSILRRIT